MRKLAQRTGWGVWVGLIANLIMIAMVLSFLAIPRGTNFHSGATEFSFLIYSVGFGITTVAICFFDLLRFRWLALLGFVLAVTPYFLSDVLLGYVITFKHFHEIY